MNGFKKKIFGGALLLGLSLSAGISLATTNPVTEAKAESFSVTYKVASTTSVSTTGTAPKGSSATFNNTYTTKEQMTKGNSQTWTFSGYSGYVIESVTLSMKSNKSSGAGTFSLEAGKQTLAEISSSTTFNKWYDSGAYSTAYKDVHVEMKNTSYVIGDNENVVMVIATTANSLYCQSATITYVPGIADTPTKATLDFNVNDTFVGLNGKLEYTMKSGSQQALSTHSWSSSNSEVVSINADTGEYTALSAGSAEITLTGTDADNFEYSVTKTMNVSAPITVAEALAIINGLNGETQQGYVEGYVSEIQIYTTSGYATYKIVDAINDDASLSVYRGFYKDGANFESAEQIQVGDKVTVYGTLSLYRGETPQMNAGSKIIHHTAPRRFSLSAENLECVNGMTAKITGVPINFDGTPAYSVSFDGEAIATYQIEGNVITFTGTKIGTSTVTVTVTEGEETLTDKFQLSVVAPYPTKLYKTGFTQYTDTQTFADGEGTLTAEYVDGSQKALSLTDEGVRLEVNGKEVFATDSVAPYDGASLKIYYEEDGHTATLNAFSITVNAELAITALTLDQDYLLVGSAETVSGMIEYTSLNGTPTVEVESSDTSRVLVNLETPEFSETTGAAMFSLSLADGAAAGQAVITAKLTYGERVETKQIVFSVRASAPSASTGVTYRQVTSLDDVTTGRYVIGANAGEEGYFGMSSTLSNKKATSYGLTVANGVATADQLEVFDVVKDPSSGITIKNSEGKYLTGSTSTDISYGASAHNWQVSAGKNGTFRLISASSSSRCLTYRVGTYNVFANYGTGNPTTGSKEYFDIELFKEITNQEPFDMVSSFVANYLYMDSISLEDQGTGACLGENGLYIQAKKAWNKMVKEYTGEEDLLAMFQTQFADGYARYNAWAVANGDANPFDGKDAIQSASNRIGMTSGSTSSIALASLAAVGAISLGGLFLLRKKRESK